MPSHKKILFATILGVFLGWQLLAEAGVLGIEQAFAQSDIFTRPSSGGLPDFLSTLSVFFVFGEFLSYVLIYILSVLIDPATILEINESTGFDSDGGLLLTMWQISRNLVNVLFAFMLIGLAVYSTVTNNRELIVSNVRKFILAIILVNFSWFFPRVVLDVANILTATIYSIPSELSVECKTYGSDGEPDKDCQYISQVFLFPERGGDADGCLGNASSIKMNGLVCMNLAPLDQDANTGLGMLHGLYVNHIRIIHMGKVVNRQIPPGGIGQIQELLRFMVQFMFVFFYMLASVFPLIALTAAFIVRIPIIWLTISFMPFMFVGFLVGDKMGEMNTMNLIWKNFLTSAFLPTIVAIPLATGFIMISQGMLSVGGNCPGGLLQPLCGGGPLIDGSMSFWHLLWNIMAIGVIWVGVFGVMKNKSIYSSIANSVSGVGRQWIGFGLKAPLAAPILPLPGGATPLSAAQTAAYTLKNPSRALVGLDGRFGGKDSILGRPNQTTGGAGSQNVDASRRAELSNFATQEGGEIRRALDTLATEYRRDRNISSKQSRDMIAVLRNQRDLTNRDYPTLLREYNGNQSSDQRLGDEFINVVTTALNQSDDS